MKHFRVLVLIFGLILLFISPSGAVDVKINGEFMVGGLYLDKTTFRNNDAPSTAFYFQRLRLNSTVTIAPGLMLITRQDIMERVWGASRSAPGTALETGSSGTGAENENIAIDWAYLQYASPFGTLRAGYMNDNIFGTIFADGAGPKGKVAWSYAGGPWYFTLQFVKMGEANLTAKSPSVTASDMDNNKTCAAVKYTWKNGEAGVLGGVGRDASTRAASQYKALFYTAIPYAIVQWGPLKLQAEADYFWGKWRDYESSTADVKLDSLSAWVDATLDFGKFYAGGSIAYVSGDDPGTTDKLEANSLLVNGGRDWKPCLILFNYDLYYWSGSQAGYNPAAAALNPYGYNGGPMTNAWFFQARGGLRLIDKLDISASLSYAHTDKKPTSAWIHGDYGYEFDLMATYKITKNLSYMAGFGYLFTGDYYKGESDSNKVNDNYLVINKLTLSF